MTVLWLDDVRKPWQHGYIGADWAKTYDEAVKLVSSRKFDFFDLDHDLTERATLGHWDGEMTGHEFLEFVDRACLWPPLGVRVHSVSEEGKKRMLVAIKAHYGRTFQDGPRK